MNRPHTNADRIATPSRPSRMPGRLDPCPRAALRQIIDATAEVAAAAVVAALPPGVPANGASRRRATAILLSIAEETARLAIWTGRQGRIVRRSELGAFVVLGGKCRDSGVAAEDMVTTLDAAGEAVLDALIYRARQCDERWTPEQIEQTIVALCGSVETLTRFAYDELVNGYFAERCGLSTTSSRPIPPSLSPSLSGQSSQSGERHSLHAAPAPPAQRRSPILPRRVA